jgi:N-acetylglutamate synthase-like GNAT family acetyltransferase
MNNIDTKSCHDEIDTKLAQLEFVRLKIPRLIPLELIESVKGRTFTPEQFYINQEQNIDNPYNLLYALIDEKKKIHGYLWAVVEWDGSLFVNTFSITKEYWGKGKAIAKVCEFLKEIIDKVKINKVFWATTNEKFFMKHGFRKSKIQLMEYNSN